MRSRASYQGHPIHPALIPFPFAFLTGAFVFDLLAWLFSWPSLWTTATHMTAVGIVMAMVAAIPGTIDYIYTVPPASTGKQRARKHALANVSAVVLFTLAWFARDSMVPTLDVIGIELVGTGLLGAGGWMGGVLVNRNQIGVDHRYAGAGKWQERTIAYKPGESVVVGKVRR